MNEINNIINNVLPFLGGQQPIIMTEHRVGVTDDSYWKIGLMVLGLMILGTVIRVLIENKLKN